MGLLDLRIEKSTRKIQIIHKLLLHPVHSSLLISIIDNLQLSAGIPTPVLSSTNQPMSRISSIWMLKLINFMQTYQIRIIIPNLLSFTIQRINDKNITDKIIQTRLKEKQLRKINSCRIFLNIIHLSDICHLNSVDIYHQFLSGEKRKLPQSTRTWHIQPKTSLSSWQLLNKTIRTKFGIQDNNKLLPHLTMGK